ncbi:chloroplastic,Probable acyl-activating enzyme 16 [Trichinella spiralis]|uniref:Chloroplastic,Probable acyl-activating enzyme 16 n=1 Tax=Trichinella spiralis TaxID=6334 RepID=A0ABR3KW74_TRISP
MSWKAKLDNCNSVVMIGICIFYFMVTGFLQHVCCIILHCSSAGTHELCGQRFPFHGYERFDARIAKRNNTRCGQRK